MENWFARLFGIKKNVVATEKKEEWVDQVIRLIGERQVGGYVVICGRLYSSADTIYHVGGESVGGIYDQGPVEDISKIIRGNNYISDELYLENGMSEHAPRSEKDIYSPPSWTASLEDYMDIVDTVDTIYNEISRIKPVLAIGSPVVLMKINGRHRPIVCYYPDDEWTKLGYSGPALIVDTGSKLKRVIGVIPDNLDQVPVMEFVQEQVNSFITARVNKKGEAVLYNQLRESVEALRRLVAEIEEP